MTIEAEAGDGVIQGVAIADALYWLCLRIEKCGASPDLTQAVMLCSDLRGAVSGDGAAAARVVEMVDADRNAHAAA